MRNAGWLILCQLIVFTATAAAQQGGFRWPAVPREGGGGTAPALILVENWFEELREKVGR